MRNLLVIGALTMAAAGVGVAEAGPVTGGLTASGAATLSRPEFGAVTRTGAYVGLPGTDAILKPLAIGGGPIVDFVTFASDPVTRINLTGIAPGAFGSAECGAAPAAGQTCSLPGSPMSFINTPTGSTMTISLTADLVNTSTGASSSGTILYATQFAGQPYQKVLAKLNGGESITSGYSAEFESAGGTVGLRGLSKVTSTLLTFPAPPEYGGSKIGWPSWPFGVLAQEANSTFAGVGGASRGGRSFGAGAGPIADFPTFAAPVRYGDFLNLESAGFGSASCDDAVSEEPCNQPGAPQKTERDSAGNGPSAGSFDGAPPMRDISGVTPFQVPVGAARFAESSYEQLLADLAESLGGPGEGNGNNGGLGVPSVSLAPLSFAPESPEAPEVVPEPSSLVLVAVGLAGALARRQWMVAGARC